MANNAQKFDDRVKMVKISDDNGNISILYFFW